MWTWHGSARSSPPAPESAADPLPSLRGGWDRQTGAPPGEPPGPAQLPDPPKVASSGRDDVLIGLP